LLRKKTFAGGKLKGVSGGWPRPNNKNRGTEKWHARRKKAQGLAQNWRYESPPPVGKARRTEVPQESELKGKARKQGGA